MSVRPVYACITTREPEEYPGSSKGNCYACHRRVLYAKWDKKERDVVYGGTNKPDGGTLAHFFSIKDSDGKSLVDELRDRGYDLTTLRFTIRQK